MFRTFFMQSNNCRSDMIRDCISISFLWWITFLMFSKIKKIPHICAVSPTLQGEKLVIASVAGGLFHESVRFQAIRLITTFEVTYFLWVLLWTAYPRPQRETTTFETFHLSFQLVVSNLPLHHASLYFYRRHWNRIVLLCIYNVYVCMYCMFVHVYTCICVRVLILSLVKLFYASIMEFSSVNNLWWDDLS